MENSTQHKRKCRYHAESKQNKNAEYVPANKKGEGGDEAEKEEASIFIHNLSPPSIFPSLCLASGFLSNRS